MARRGRRTAGGEQPVGGINLAGQPFVNARPVVRTALLLWVLGAFCIGLAAWQFYEYYAGRADQRAEIARIEDSMSSERSAIADLERQLSGLALDNQNSRVAFLNQRIAERTFSWSLLFDRLADILPDDVRLQTLSPQFSYNQPRRARSAAQEDGRQTEVLLNLFGSARSTEALLELIDVLFADPAFERPNPHQESREGGGDTRFSLTVTYLPGEAEPAATDDVEEIEDAGATATADLAPAAVGGGA